MNAKYNKSVVMKLSWQLFKKQDVRTMEMYSNCLKQAWHIVKNGKDTFSIEQVYSKYYKPIYWFILQKLQYSNIAQELTNEVFLRYNSNITYDVYKGKISTLLYKIANNLVIDYYRTNSRKKDNINISDFTDENGNEYLPIVSYNSTESNYIVENSELKTRIDKAFSKLKPNYKKVAELYFIEEKQYKEIAEILQMPMNSVKIAIMRAKEKLQKELSNVQV